VVKSVKVIPRGLTECHGEDSLADGLADAMVNTSRVTSVDDVLCDRADWTEAIFGVTKQDDARDGGEPLIDALNIDGAGGPGLDQVALSFTHRVVFSVSEGFCFSPPKRRRS